LTGGEDGPWKNSEWFCIAEERKRRSDNLLKIISQSSGRKSYRHFVGVNWRISRTEFLLVFFLRFGSDKSLFYGG